MFSILLQVVNEKSMQDTCGNKPLCVVSVLPHILDCDAACRNAFLNILKTMGEKYKKKMWGYVESFIYYCLTFIFPAQADEARKVSVNGDV